MVLPNWELLQGAYVPMQVMELPPRHPTMPKSRQPCEHSIKDLNSGMDILEAICIASLIPNYTNLTKEAMINSGKQER